MHLSEFMHVYSAYVRAYTRAFVCPRSHGLRCAMVILYMYIVQKYIITLSMCTFVLTCVHMPFPFIFTYVYIHVSLGFVCVWLFSMCARNHGPRCAVVILLAYVCMYVCMCNTRMCVCIYIYIYIYIRMCVCVCVCVWSESMFAFS